MGNVVHLIKPALFELGKVKLTSFPSFFRQFDLSKHGIVLSELYANMNVRSNESRASSGPDSRRSRITI